MELTEKGRLALEQMYLEQLEELLRTASAAGKKRHPKSIACDKIRELFIKVLKEQK